jgi:hypothetical protein
MLAAWGIAIDDDDDDDDDVYGDVISNRSLNHIKRAHEPRVTNIIFSQAR